MEKMYVEKILFLFFINFFLFFNMKEKFEKFYLERFLRKKKVNS